MKLFIVLAAVLAVAYATEPRIVRTKDGQVSMAFGDFGTVTRDAKSVAAYLRTEMAKSVLGLQGDETFRFFNDQNNQDKVHTFRFEQEVNGLPVVGGRFSVHVTVENNKVHGFSGVPALKASLPRPQAALPFPQEAIAVLTREFKLEDVKVIRPARLVYASVDEKYHLAYHFVVEAKDVAIPQHGKVHSEPHDIYVDAMDGRVLFYVPHYKKALVRYVYDTDNTQNLPGTLVRSEGEPASSDENVNQAYDNAGYCYNYYFDVFGRDSYDDNGASLNSTVHYGVNYDNAFWNGEQMVYGDGDNIIFSAFTNDLSVICHELSHAVTEYTSGLIYWQESGALNEAYSDIMGASSVFYTNAPNGLNVDDQRINPDLGWVVGHNITLILFSPGQCPDCPLGLRYMDFPANDGQSADYYPEKNTGIGDLGHVHTNSGIANLAYSLTVQGGVHPRQKTNTQVLGIGLAKAEQIFYLGFTQYLTSNSQFCNAREATIQAANELYPNDSNPSPAIQVAAAWDTVGVSDC
eukprot:CAMPEP_0119120254 /NCGR_PEP_ID=MMETSP1310-20130426/1366_1 /TAXON_ID=464262 /ORGANISM="Genus nov. species nov., Strain RCC2339" /LENGTH=519 /DNA_ID=CAMNT_0007109721 /DNA_START=68 /DNA_END=1627 /DNA_ORIENTATION=-